ncbi:hypothetical protein [Taklimakanibacter deserti]|uniref:hypothetical protein n=1 Tax=Taklimakanibacter deserti TaxID=2267839 RepID=UPI000E6560AA
MTLNHGPVSPYKPSRDFLTQRSIPSTVVATLLLSVLVLLATYILGGFDGLTGNGAAALIFGVIASFALGIGLMVAVFYSSRKYDDAAHYAAMDHFTKESRSSDEPNGRE